MLFRFWLTGLGHCTSCEWVSAFCEWQSFAMFPGPTFDGYWGPGKGSFPTVLVCSYGEY
jgi:hypothetical protein